MHDRGKRQQRIEHNTTQGHRERAEAYLSMLC